MLDEKVNQQQQEVVIESAQDYAEAIKDLKEKTVSKEEYDKVVADKKTLIRALSEGQTLPDSGQKENKPDIKELRQKFLNAGELNLSNAEYIKTALALRQASIESGEGDPFLPTNSRRAPTIVDLQGAEKVAETLQGWLEEATDEEGRVDEDLLNAQIKKGIADDGPLMLAKMKARAGKRK